MLFSLIIFLASCFVLAFRASVVIVSILPFSRFITRSKTLPLCSPLTLTMSMPNNFESLVVIYYYSEQIICKIINAPRYINLLSDARKKRTQALAIDNLHNSCGLLKCPTLNKEVRCYLYIIHVGLIWLRINHSKHEFPKNNGVAELRGRRIDSKIIQWAFHFL